jgi:cytochrome c-type biogenesis protein CcmF
MIVHLGIIIIGVAIAASTSFVRQGEFTLRPGESAALAGHTITYEGFTETDFDERINSSLRLTVDGDVVEPAIDQFRVSGRIVPDPATRTTFTEDVQLAVIALPDDTTNAATVRATVQPLIVWLWLGGLVVAVGTVLSAFPGKRRRGTEAVSAPVGDSIEVPAHTPPEREPEGAPAG